MPYLIQRYRKILNIKSILLTRAEAISALFKFDSKDDIVSVLDQRGIDYRFVDDTFSPSSFLIFSNIVTALLKIRSSNPMFLMIR